MTTITVDGGTAIYVGGCPHCGTNGPAILAALAGIKKTLGEIMSEQSQLDTDVQALEALDARLVTAVTAIQAEIDALKAANPAVDFTGLESAVTDLTNATTAVEGLEPPAAPAG